MDVLEVAKEIMEKLGAQKHLQFTVWNFITYLR